jgi:3-hydroxymyristoyl/3-hydroxydecanoyl-(acyl carrier protein) dehydratase
MNNPLSPYPSVRLQNMALESARNSSALHRQFLHMRREGLQNARALIEMQITSTPAGPAQTTLVTPALFDSPHLDAFGTGRIADCLGPAFAKYDGRRIPRIPNGDLKMMSRIVSIEGKMGSFTPPASITAEYDVPREPWYQRDSASAEIPTGLWMEIALQPCGFLSAYLDTYALAPSGEFYFRNLDGWLRLVEKMDVRGKILATRAWLLSHATSGGAVIQKFGFEISCGGRVLYEGESTFGYFSAASMASQVGLDGGRVTAPALRLDGELARRAMRVDLRRLQSGDPSIPGGRLARGRLHFIDDLYVLPDGGQHGRGYACASRLVDPQDWYFPFHFYQDPVMPGSLGVEAILETMRGFALVTGLGRGLRSPRFGAPVRGYAPGAEPMTWRYRGQITRQNRLVEMEVHLSALVQRAGYVTLLGDACLWADGLRIYEVKNASIGILEG